LSVFGLLHRTASPNIAPRIYELDRLDLRPQVEHESWVFLLLLLPSIFLSFKGGRRLCCRRAGRRLAGRATVECSSGSCIAPHRRTSRRVKYGLFSARLTFSSRISMDSPTEALKAIFKGGRRLCCRCAGRRLAGLATVEYPRAPASHRIAVHRAARERASALLASSSRISMAASSSRISMVSPRDVCKGSQRRCQKMFFCILSIL